MSEIPKRQPQPQGDWFCYAVVSRGEGIGVRVGLSSVLTTVLGKEANFVYDEAQYIGHFSGNKTPYVTEEELKSRLEALDIKVKAIIGFSWSDLLNEARRLEQLISSQEDPRVYAKQQGLITIRDTVPEDKPVEPLTKEKIRKLYEALGMDPPED